MLTPMPFSTIAMMAKSSHVIKRISGCTWYCSSRSETSVFPPCSSNKNGRPFKPSAATVSFFCKRVVRRQHNLIFILLQQNCVELWKSGKPQKAAVHPAFIDPMLNFFVVAQQHFIFNAGIVPLQRGEKIWQPVDGYAGEGSDPDDARFKPVHPADLAFQLLMILQNLVQKRQNLFSGGGQADAFFAAFHQCHAPFRFQIGNHLAD